MALYRGQGGAGDANNTVSINEIQQLSSDAQLAKNYAEEWANKAEDSLISTDAGGDNVDDYSAMHHAQKANADAVTTAADVVSTNADVVTTGNNVTAAQTAETNAETAETNAVIAKDAAEAAAATVPPYDTITGEGSNFVRLNTGETSMEFRTPAEVLADIGAEAADGTILKDADIGSTVQGYDAGLAYLDGLDFTNEATFKQGVNLELGTDVQAYDAGLAYLDGLNFTNESTFKSGVNLELGVDVQAYDAAIMKTDVAQVMTEQLTVKEIRETVYTMTGTDIDPANGSIQDIVLTANRTLTESIVSGQPVTLRIEDGTDYTITWPTITWLEGSAPELATTGRTMVELIQISGVLYGIHVGDFA